MSDPWTQLTEIHQTSKDLQTLFLENPNRFAEFSVLQDDLLLDYSKTQLTAETLSLLVSLAAQAGVEKKRDAMFAGEKINTTENRAVLHTALRNVSGTAVLTDGADVMPEIERTLAAVYAFAEDVRSGRIAAADGARFTDVVNIGIGGSDLGPVMVAGALAPYHDGPKIHFVSNVDGAHLADTVKSLDPARTLVIVASKTFTTTETMTNAHSARRWIAGALGEGAVAAHFAAVSTALDKVGSFGILPERIFGFWDWVGGRYSVWSAIGLAVVIAIGEANFQQFLAGAHAMDVHFRQAEVTKNLPMLLGLVGIWHRNICGYPARAVLPYDQRLARFPAYLQQLDMESNGKRVVKSGEAVVRETGPQVWGEPGTNGQHAFYQLLHQGTDIIPCEFLIAAHGHEPELREHHALLIVNCLAQSEALLKGKTLEQAKGNPHRMFPGNRPSVTLAYTKLDPHTLGRLIALYEHRVFVEAAIWDVNAYDQWGVELGKELAAKLLPVFQGARETAGLDSSTAGLCRFSAKGRDDMIPLLLDIASIHAGYRDGSLTPVALFTALLDRVEEYPDKAVFISRFSREAVLAQAAALDPAQIDTLPLFGIPFAVKDNIDVAGIPTTAACTAFAYQPAVDGFVVGKLRAAGAIVLGKTNLDQFATGLNGTRSPYGAPRSVFNAEYISGGSSSGSSVAVAAGLVCFSLGTDTAGSGRVPAGINNLIGLKPSVGRLSSTGMVPACKSLDCISTFANSAADALAVLTQAEGYDAADCYSRALTEVGLPRQPVFGTLSPAFREFAGDGQAEQRYDAAIAAALALGWTEQKIDYAPFLDIAKSLYGGAFVAERLAAVEGFYKTNADDFDPAVRSIIASAEKFSAADLFNDIYRLQARKLLAQAELAKCDILLLPTAPTHFTVAELRDEPIARNSVLGTYTNFVNLMDLAAIALPAGFGENGLAYGVTLVGPAFSEHALGGYADQLHKSLGAGSGKSKLVPASFVLQPAADEITLVVAGAHLSGMVLNHELTALGAKLVAETKTAANYQLFELATTPPKPGLVRCADGSGAPITVEVWTLTPERFGRFVAALPPPMGIGKVTLADGTEHPGFLCEVHALTGAKDITSFGGWRAYKKAV